MQCARCNWQNPAAHKVCFNCNAPLSLAPSAAGSPAPAAARDTRVFASFWARLGATAIDASFMVGAIVVLCLAASYTYQGLTGDHRPTVLLLAAGLLGWLLPAFMDAWGNGSPGKRLLKLRVVTRQGSAPGLLRSFWRHTLKYTLNVALPGIFHHLQQTIFGERAVHNSLAGTHVVSSQADPRKVNAAVATAPAVTGAGKFLITVFGVLALVLAGIVLGAVALDKDEDSPLRAEVAHLDRVSDPIRRVAESHYQRTGTFAPDIAALGITQASLDAIGFSRLDLNPVNGVLRFTIAGEPGTAESPSLGGRHLAYLPELRSEKKGGGVRRWQCGSDDIPREDRPYGCRHETGAFAR
ncbi:RDD family protein [Achromobacter sp.]|uniref:RDD family protein n=1 Tax=Achromobacter sp. TaxID=134375 RepID=UPI0028AC101C|nr:RDD family protein [Achromobacter sp.]